MNRKLGEEAILDSWRYPLLFTVQKTPPSCLPFFHTKNSLPHYYAVSVCCVWSLLEVAFFFSYSVLVNFKRRTVVLYTCQLFITWNAHMDGFQIKLPVFQTCVFCYLSFSRIMSKAVFYLFILLTFYFLYHLRKYLSLRVPLFWQAFKSSSIGEILFIYCSVYSGGR